MLLPHQRAKIMYSGAKDALKEQQARGRETLRSRGISPKVFWLQLREVVKIPEWYKVTEYGVYLTYCEQIDLNPEMSVAEFAVFRFGDLTTFVDGVKLTWLEAGLILENAEQL